MTKWIIDPDHSSVTFSIRHMMIANIRGQFSRIEGSVIYDPLDIYNASIELTIDAASIFTGSQKRDEHLKSPDFFDVEHYPAITFRSVRIHSVEDNKANVTGNLTIHGVRREVDISVEISGPQKDPFGDGLSMGFSASAVIDREDYGVMWNQAMESNGIMVGREVSLLIDLEADLAAEG